MTKPGSIAIEYTRLTEGSPVRKYVLDLYIAGSAPRSRRAVVNVRKICEGLLKGLCDLQVIDIFQQPLVAKTNQICAVPTLIKKFPDPTRLFIGDMSNTDDILAAILD
jgi:circadian clock protein KaiB